MIYNPVPSALGRGVGGLQAAPFRPLGSTAGGNASVLAKGPAEAAALGHLCHHEQQL